MKVAIIGTGIAGNVASYHLSKSHDITVFEANNYIGGHTHTHQMQVDGQTLAVDSGFIVFNHRTYPNFVQLLRELQVPWQMSDMSFSVRSVRKHSSQTNLEYNGTNLNGLFAQRSNLLRPSFHQMLREIFRFNRESVLLLDKEESTLTFGEFLREGKYSQQFIDNYIIPMGAAIWSTSPELMLEFPAQFFIRFFDNHGMLTIDDRPDWYVIEGGSSAYVEKLTATFRDRIRLSCPVERVWRFPNRVEIESRFGRESFDAVFFACHSDQALRLLAEPSDLEQQLLSAFPYQKNHALLHSDPAVMPRRQRAWASWNYYVPAEQTGKPMLSYHMNRLQSLPCQQPFFVTLNAPEQVAYGLVHKELSYDHPLFTPEGVKAQPRQAELNGGDRTFYCGAYWRYGFHEDGVVSALNALEHFNDWQQHQQRDLRRLG